MRQCTTPELDQTALAIWVRLGLISSLGSKKFFRLMEIFGSPEALVNAKRRELEQLGVPNPLLTALLKPDWNQIEKHMGWLEQPHQHLVPIDSMTYPTQLKMANSPPMILWVKGNLHSILQPQLAIVGSRKPSRTGKSLAKKFAAELANCGLTITSGLALGIDAQAHLGALESGRPTIAVFGTGLDQIYPSVHRELSEQIVTNGALVSEFPLGTTPKPQHFPRRNRIISGLSMGVLVVEAGLRSGSLITANYSANFGREVFAIPGSIESPTSIGCHKLIKEGAKLVDCLDDILSELTHFTSHLSADNQDPAQNTQNQSLDPESHRLLDSLRQGPASLDDLVEATGFTTADLLSKLLLLELENRVETLEDGRFAQSPK